ncbi:MAG: helix-turn-helix domain-containing protein [Pseudomonadota bacterium]
MKDLNRYPLYMGTEVSCRILGIDPLDMIARAGLEELVLSNGFGRATAGQYFDAWNAIDELCDRPDLVTYLGTNIARGPVIPPFFALLCAPNLEIGLSRLTHYKSLLGPTFLQAFRKDDLLWLEFESADPSLEVPPSLGAVHLVYFVEATRLATATSVSPVLARLNGSEPRLYEIADHLGVVPELGANCSLAYKVKDAQRTFISQNPRLWEDFEKDLNHDLELLRRSGSLTSQVRAALINLFPSGRCSADDISTSMSISRSTLQRRLRKENTSFQSILDETRKELAIRYLTKSSLPNSEIAALLAYRDTNSFSRAFRRWINLSPGDFRAQSSL